MAETIGIVVISFVVVVLSNILTAVFFYGLGGRDEARRNLKKRDI